MYLSLICRIKEIIGYDSEEILTSSEFLVDLFHPDDYRDMVALADEMKSKSTTKQMKMCPCILHCQAACVLRWVENFHETKEAFSNPITP